MLHGFLRKVAADSAGGTCWARDFLDLDGALGFALRVAAQYLNHSWSTSASRAAASAFQAVCQVYRSS
jgi:hypothetical protein